MKKGASSEALFRIMPMWRLCKVATFKNKIQKRVYCLSQSAVMQNLMFSLIMV